MDDARPTSRADNAVIPLADVEYLREARRVIRHESDVLREVAASLDSAFCDAVSLILKARGSVIVTGVGKAGLIGQKIVATMASTGTRSHFLHPTEAMHGDLGCVCSDDVVLALSNSGESEEICRLMPCLRQMRIPVIAITATDRNTVARQADIVLRLGKHNEAGPLGLAPTSSTTAMLAMGDALALVLSSATGFSANEFARFHPAGKLGSILRPVRDVMRRAEEMRLAHRDTPIRAVLVEAGRPGRRTGAVIVTDDDIRVTGIFTDSDLARLLEQRRENQLDRPISEAMTHNPTVVHAGTLLRDAVQILSDRKLSELPVVDDQGRPLGLLDITDVIGFADIQHQHNDGAPEQTTRITPESKRARAS